MLLTEKISSFLTTPYPLWEKEITKILVEKEWRTQLEAGIDEKNYNTARTYFNKPTLRSENPILITGDSLKNSIFLEYPSFDALSKFYEEHGLEFESLYRESEYIPKLQAALSMLNLIPEVKDCMSILIRCIQVLKQDDDEIDTSYTHPEIPFTVFVSLCKDTSEISNLRVAESILHEAMHLKLTLIEKHVDLVVPETTETFYSPWRDEQRPVRGVLHGLFVFRAILDFYSELKNNLSISNNSLNYITQRKEDITDELQSIKDIYKSQGFTLMGASLLKNLLPSN